MGRGSVRAGPRCAGPSNRQAVPAGVVAMRHLRSQQLVDSLVGNAHDRGGEVAGAANVTSRGERLVEHAVLVDRLRWDAVSVADPAVTDRTETDRGASADDVVRGRVNVVDVAGSLRASDPLRTTDPL